MSMSEVDKMEDIVDFEADTSEDLISTEAIDSIFEEIQNMSVDLDSDPLSFGPTRLQKKVAKVRNLQTRVQRLFLLVSQADHQIQRVLHAIEADINMKKDDLLSSDPDVMGAPSVKDREALCNIKLRAEVQERMRFEKAQLETQGALQVLKSQQRDLKGLTARLKDQKRLCEDEIALGRAWGSKVPHANVNLESQKQSSAVEDVEGLVRDVLDGDPGRDGLTVEMEVDDEDETTEEKVVEKKSSTVDKVTLPERSSNEASKFVEANHSTESIDSALDGLSLDDIPDGSEAPDEEYLVTSTDLPEGFWDTFD